MVVIGLHSLFEIQKLNLPSFKVAKEFPIETHPIANNISWYLTEEWQ